jgi:hypothetical protein
MYLLHATVMTIFLFSLSIFNPPFAKKKRKKRKRKTNVCEIGGGSGVSRQGDVRVRLR